MLNLYMPVSAAIISAILLFVYCAKEKVKIKENTIYLIMLICVLCDSLLLSGICINAGEGENLTITRIFNRCDFLILATWSSCLCRYSHAVIHKKDDENQKRLRFTRRLMTCLGVFECLGILFARIDIVFEGEVARSIVGPAVYFTFACCALNIIVSLLVIICNIRKITKQVIPVFSFLGISGLTAIVYYYNPGISGVSLGLTIVNLTMYFTIENPDVQMLEAVNFAKEQAQKANQAKTDFLSSMSHEIRTPINAISGFADCILNDETLELAKRDAKEILAASENLLEIVNGILDISKIEAGRMEVVNKEYDPLDMAEKLSKLIKARIGEKPIELRLIFSKNIPGVLFGDETKIRQIVTNLLTNAVKYTEDGYIDFIFDCINEDGVSKLSFTVSDTGHGIKEEDLGKLFDKFKRLEEDRNSSIEGTGLGLAITKQFVEMLGGTIEAQSVYGKGSTFTFRVSQKIVSFEREIKEEEIEENKEYPGRRMLIVDDTATNLVVARRLLELYKISADTAASGEECIEKCKANTYELILLDDMMPKMSGRETLKKLMEIPSFATPTVAFTANAIDGMRESYLNAGYKDYLSKPLVKSELSRILEKYLG